MDQYHRHHSFPIQLALSPLPARADSLSFHDPRCLRQTQGCVYSNRCVSHVPQAGSHWCTWGPHPSLFRHHIACLEPPLHPSSLLLFSYPHTITPS